MPIEIKSVHETKNSACCGKDGAGDGGRPLQFIQPLPMARVEDDEAPCCGAPQGPPSSPFERPGYSICSFVDGFMETPVGPVPRVFATHDLADSIGTVRARLGINRDQYKVAPGLYCIGSPTPESPVLVTANYKLSFDTLRGELAELDLWLLVLDTRGVNVWCAAGKKNFSTAELIGRVKKVGLEKVVSHRQLILPQLGAPGVAAHEVVKGCGFKVRWGPIRAADLREFLARGSAPPAMRQVTFSLRERLVLIPVEISLILKPSLLILLAVFLLSGISPQIYSPAAVWTRGSAAAVAYVLGIVAGAVAVPVLLPWLPGRSFYLKGILTGLLAGVAGVLSLTANMRNLELLAMILLSVAVSSYAAMNFTGATPFTSPSGVEKEMRVAIPLQAGAILAAAICWLGAPFVS